jgi:hypothetical protein
MAITTIASPFLWPAAHTTDRVPFLSTGYPTTVLDDNGVDRLGMIWYCAEAGTLTAVKVYATAKAGTPNPTISASVQSVGAADGNPTGTVLGPTANATGTVQVTAAGWWTITFAESVPLSVGTAYAIVVTLSSFQAGQSVTLSRTNTGISQRAYCDDYNVSGTGAWTHLASPPNLVLMYNTARPVQPDVYPTHADNSGFEWIYASDTSGVDEYGVAFQVPVTMRVVGYGMHMRASGDVNLMLSSGLTSPTALATVALDKDVGYSTSDNGMNMAWLSSPQTLSPGTTYIVSAQPSSAAVIRVQYGKVHAAVDLTQNFPPTWYTVGRLNGGNFGTFTNSDLYLPAVCLMVNGIDTGGATSSRVLAIGGML